MTIKDILVHLDESPQSETRMGIALELAKTHDARITANHTAVSQLVEKPEEAMAVPEKAFRERAADAGVDADFCGYFGEPQTIMALHAQVSDIVIVGHSQGSSIAAPSSS